MPSGNFVRDSLVVAALVIVLVGAATLTARAVLAYVAGDGDRAVPSPVAIAILYLLAVGLILFLWRSRDRPSAA